MIVLAITIVLIAALFMYVRHRLMVVDSRIELLSDTIQTMAGVTCATLHDSDSESESSDDETECSDLPLEYEDRFPTPERTMVSDDDVKRVALPETEVGEIEVKKTDPVELAPEIEPELVPDTSRQIVVDTPLESLTLKELKDKVAELNGPKLKTKKELLDFLQKI